MRSRSTPRRILGWATLVNMTGSGAYIASLTIFLVQSRNVTAAAAAACILVGTLGGKFGALPFGTMIDRLGGKRTYISSKAISGLAAAALVEMKSPVVITGCLTIYGLSSAVGGSARNVIIRDIADSETKIYRARLRSLANTGIVCGSGLAAAALALDVLRGSAACIVLNSVSCLVCASLVAAGIPTEMRRKPRPADADMQNREVVSRGVPMWRLLTRPRLVMFFVASAVFSLLTPVLTYAIPLWISEYVYPRDAWPVGILVATNAVIVIALQVPVGHLVDRSDRPDAVMVWAGVTLGAGLATAGASFLVSGLLSLAGVWLAVVVVSLAEVLLSAATTELLFAPDLAHQLSRTSSLLTFACAVGEAVGPALLLAIALRTTAMGWLAVAVAVWVCALSYARFTALMRSREIAERSVTEGLA
ncbi:MFS transporter [Streptomyces sp. NPDC102364]|uniref:MFS transporter n=1 Tax=Streptomyces sp. NPDC102364 TaxID=3366161 RepID=UPI0037F67AD4